MIYTNKICDFSANFTKNLVYSNFLLYLCSPKDKQFYFMFIIGIAGGTGSGKTTVVRKLIERLPKGEVVVIPQDSYYKDSSHVPVEERQNINFDHPDAFDWDLLTKHIALLKEGKPIEQPIYSYITCTRSEETVHIEPREVIVVEGIMALREPKMRDQILACFDEQHRPSVDKWEQDVRNQLRKACYMPPCYLK